MNIAEMPNKATLETFIEGGNRRVVFHTSKGRFEPVIPDDQTTGLIKEMPTREILEQFLGEMIGGKTPTVVLDRERGVFEKRN